MKIVAQIIAFIAFILFVSSVQMKRKKQLILFQLFANLLYGISYLLLNTPIAGFMNMTSVVRCLLLYYSREKPSKIYLYILVCIILLLGIFMYQTPLSLIPVCITILYTISTWQDDMKVIRYLFIIAGFFWIMYNFSVGAYIAIIGNVFEVISGATSIIRYRKSNN